MSDVHEGGCLCRDIRYRAVGLPLEAIVCHCTFCQRRTGAAFGIGVFFLRTTLSSQARSQKHTSTDRKNMDVGCG